MLFRTVEHVPESYIDGSRDFQLLCRLKDLTFNATKYNIDSLRHTSNTSEINSRLLELLKSKVGFFSDISLSMHQLRAILAAYPTLMHFKGSKLALKYVVYLWLRITQVNGKLLDDPIINNKDHTIQFNLESDNSDVDILDCLMRNVLPTGYIIKYEFTERDDTNKTKFNMDDPVEVVWLSNNSDNYAVRSKDPISGDYVVKYPSSYESIDTTDITMDSLNASVGLIGVAESIEAKPLPEGDTNG